MYVAETHLGLCLVLENTGDIAKCLSSFLTFNETAAYRSGSVVSGKVIEHLEDELSR